MQMVPRVKQQPSAASPAHAPPLTPTQHMQQQVPVPWSPPEQLTPQQMPPLQHALQMTPQMGMQNQQMPNVMASNGMPNLMPNLMSTPQMMTPQQVWPQQQMMSPAGQPVAMMEMTRDQVAQAGFDPNSVIGV